MASGGEAPESWYLALLGFAEHFRTSSPPKIRLCVHCLQAVFQFKPPQRVEARTHLQLGSVLYHHTKNSELARNHLEKALLLMERKLQEVHPLLTLCGQIVENWQGNPIQKESLRVFFLVLQVTHYLDAGQVKSVKPCLKQLQQCIQTISTLHDDEILPSNPADLFHWLPKEHMCVLVYLVTVMHSMQAGYLEKAQKYTDKALMQLEKLKMLDCSPILSSFQVILLEHIIMCRLVTGHKATALQEGLYCISVNCMDNAEAQFTTALRLTTHQELWTFIVTNLASVYIREGNRQQELFSLLERINPDHNFPVRRFLRETLKMSNAEDLNRLTACSLVLLGHIFYVLGNHRESNNMVVPAMQLASKIPDMSVQLWSSALLKVDRRTPSSAVPSPKRTDHQPGQPAVRGCALQGDHSEGADIGAIEACILRNPNFFEFSVDIRSIEMSEEAVRRTRSQKRALERDSLPSEGDPKKMKLEKGDPVKSEEEAGGGVGDLKVKAEPGTPASATSTKVQAMLKGGEVKATIKVEVQTGDQPVDMSTVKR
ncbi:UNVERIFIED_CONTAM: hypothetical protein FKN15_056181 [Acipenser sinensis]